MEKRYCTNCEQVKDIEEFSFRYKARGIRQRWCKSCMAAANKIHYQNNTSVYIDRARVRNKMIAEENRKKLLAYLSEHPCVDCGNADIRCLEFDHVRGSKASNIGEMLGLNTWNRIEDEIEKCEVRCVNCHRIKTCERGGWWRLTLTEQAPPSIFPALQIPDI